jgi:predicted deacetylase
MPRPEAIISLHDVAPHHLPRLRRAEAVLADLGVRKATYLFVPHFHRGRPSDADADFVAWCRAEHPFAVRWFLHGYTHLDAAPSAAGLSLVQRAWSRWMTGGEGEFLPLGAAEQARRIRDGRDCFRAVLQHEPDGFVAPAWLHNAALAPVLRDAGIRIFEDHHHVHDALHDRSLHAPVITWATRTRLRRWSSILGTPFLLAAWRATPRLRLAVHPHDFDHPATIRSIERVFRRALAAREQRFYHELIIA